jgi:two-component system sensor histidine kinase ChvG
VSRRPPLLSRISVRLLAFNVLLVFLPAAGFLYLGTYERQLLRMQERSMVQQARLLAAALSEQGQLQTAEAEQILRNLQRRTEARLRVIDRQGNILADSSLLGPRREPAGEDSDLEAAGRGRLLYRLGALLAGLLPGPFARPEPAQQAPESSSPARLLRRSEIRAALDGRYGAATRISSGGQRSVTLYSAIPVRSGEEVVGAVLVSQSTFRILESLYEVRLGIFRVFLVSVGAAVVLSLIVAMTIARPLQRLRRQATQILDRRGRLKGHFRGSTRSDEIGDLARALEEQTRRLRGHLELTESFASDVSHEFKNPLASIRSATEVLGDVETPAERLRFLGIVEREVARLERLVTELQEISRIDARIEDEERGVVDLAALLDQVVEGFRLRHGPRIGIDFESAGKPANVTASPERLTQMLENLLDNAAGFSPTGGLVEVGLHREGGMHRVTIADQGPGIPPEHLDQIFTRFFSHRPTAEDPRRHVGLGLAIVRALAEGYGGSVHAANRTGGGAVFELRLPAG